MWGVTVPIIAPATPMHPAPAIVVTPPGGALPNCVAAVKHISYALTASSVAPVQDRACALKLVESAPETLARDRCMWKQSDYGVTPYWGEGVKTPLGRNPEVDASNRIPGMAEATCWVLPHDDFLATPADASEFYWMCPPYHWFSACLRIIHQEKLGAIVVGPK